MEEFLTQREKEILKMINDNPMISQNEIADILSIKRSSAAVHISNLMKKGFIKGRGYIVNNSSYTLVLGGANIDITTYPHEDLVVGDSNPGEMKMSAGGVGRNIADNLARLGVQTKFVSVVGNDQNGEMIKQSCLNAGVDISYVETIDNENTSSYISFLDKNGDVFIAFSSMDIYKKIDFDFIKKNQNTIRNSKICVLDTNLDEQVISYIVNNIEGPRYFVDPVSTSKAKKILNVLDRIYCLKPNIIEAEMLSGIKYQSKIDLIKIADYFHNQGVKVLLISLKDKGLFFSNGEKRGYYNNNKPITLKNANGAGDAFLAGYIYGDIKNLSFDNRCIYGIGASLVSLSSEDTINTQINDLEIKKYIEEFDICCQDI